MTATPIWLMTRKRLAKQQREASEWFVRLRSADPEAGAKMLSAFMEWAGQHPDNAAAFRRVTESWNALDQHAASAQIMVQRRDSLEQACRYQRRSAHRRPRFATFAASLFGLAAVALAVWMYVGTRAVVYSTGLGERRSITLSDGSTLTLDALSRVSTIYSAQSRSFSLEAGHARFEVAKDPKRPFVVRARSASVQALGTEFDVELVSDAVLVTLIDGRVAVRAIASDSQAGGGRPGSAAADAPIEMVPGDQLIAAHRKPRIVRHSERLAYATAWSEGKLFFDDEPLSRAVERINRYATEQIHIDPSAADVTISGIFNADDSAAFLEAVTSYFPITQERTSRNELVLRLREP